MSDAETEIHDISMSSGASTPRTSSQHNTESDNNSEKLVWQPADSLNSTHIGCDSPAPINIDTSSCSYTSSPILNMTTSSVLVNGEDAPILLDTSSSSLEHSPGSTIHSPTMSNSSSSSCTKVDSLFNLAASPIYCSPGSSSSRATPNSISHRGTPDDLYCGPPSPFHQPSPGPSSPIHTRHRGGSNVSIMSPLRNARSSPYAPILQPMSCKTRSQSSRSSSEDMVPPISHAPIPALSPLGQSHPLDSRNTPPLLHAETPPPVHRNIHTSQSRPSSRHTPGSVHSNYSSHSNLPSPPPCVLPSSSHNVLAHTPSPVPYSSMLTDPFLPMYGASTQSYDEYLQFMSGFLPCYSSPGVAPPMFPSLPPTLGQYTGDLAYNDTLGAAENLSSHTHSHTHT